MSYYIKPEHFQMIHYYFFSLGIVSLSSAFILLSYSLLSYLFLAFCVVNTAISWYTSYFIHTKMRDFFIINMFRYAGSHILLTGWAAGLSVFLWYFFESEFEALVLSFTIINFFMIFFGSVWYALSHMKTAEKYFEWQDRSRLEGAKRLIIEFRNSNKLKIVEDWILNEYSLGANTSLDRLFMQAKKRHHDDNVKGFAEAARGIEMALCDARLSELEKKMNKMRQEGGNENAKLLKTYINIAARYRKAIPEYDKAFYAKFGK